MERCVSKVRVSFRLRIIYFSLSPYHHKFQPKGEYYIGVFNEALIEMNSLPSAFGNGHRRRFYRTCALFFSLSLFFLTKRAT